MCRAAGLTRHVDPQDPPQADSASMGMAGQCSSNTGALTVEIDESTPPADMLLFGKSSRLHDTKG